MARPGEDDDMMLLFNFILGNTKMTWCGCDILCNVLKSSQVVHTLREPK